MRPDSGSQNTRWSSLPYRVEKRATAAVPHPTQRIVGHRDPRDGGRPVLVVEEVGPAWAWLSTLPTQ
jgi:hypothetical protein